MQAAIRAERLSKRFGNVQALAPLGLDVTAGEVLGYLGPNGAGKTTTIRLLLGLLRPTSGRAEIFGLDATRETVAAHRRLAYVAGETSLWPSLTGAETLHLLGQVQGRVDLAYRDELIERFQFDPSRKVRSYSKGNRQKLALIAGLMSRADLLLLDEPTSGLDPLMEREFRRCVEQAKAAGQTVFLSSHILAEVEALCDRVAILRVAGILHCVLQSTGLRGHISSGSSACHLCDAAGHHPLRAARPPRPRIAAPGMAGTSRRRRIVPRPARSALHRCLPRRRRVAAVEERSRQ
jgi:ABC-2 type transport system ATP-binding protein